MDKKFRPLALIGLLILLFPQCGRKDTIWDNPQMWYRSTCVNDGYADVFYLVSTNIFHEENPDGTVSYIASNTTEEKEILAEEMAFAADNVFLDSLNFFSPFYHQMTLDAAELGAEVYHRMASEVAAEVYESFKYYMCHLNGGRPVVLAGFSQGALLVKELLKMMTPEEFSRVAASYSIGWGVNEEDIRTRRVIPAQGADDTGVCISFNTVSDTSGIWPLVMDDASCSINPANWCTGEESAVFLYDGQTLTARLDTIKNVIAVDGFKESPLKFEAPWPSGCLHHYEILFYNDFLNQNALIRVNNYNLHRAQMTNTGRPNRHSPHPDRGGHRQRNSAARPDDVPRRAS